MKIKANGPLMNFENKPLKDGEKDFTMGMAIANILLAHDIGGKMKLFVLATKFYNDATVELDDADKNLVIQAVEKTTTYNNLVCGQILVELSKTK